VIDRMLVPVLRPSAAAVVAVVAVSVSVVVFASLASAVPLSGGAMGTPVVLAPPMTMVMEAAAARGSTSRVEDQAAAQMSSEAHRRVVLAALHGAASLPYGSVLNAGRAACDPHCPGKSGYPYNRRCEKIYHCSQ
jgi:hypothetical protein